ncbi:hypothetical protein TrCOL_g9118 [Triparma columacea]|uniref:Uncharacterized protein n=1 Tax=Triparma columacea TaxID=722753 RepID=A0A9W7LAH2_9STRA|nr:hypothetical protein TrCOL_g9118 [Triparma columacea]
MASLQPSSPQSITLDLSPLPIRSSISSKNPRGTKRKALVSPLYKEVVLEPGKTVESSGVCKARRVSASPSYRFVVSSIPPTPYEVSAAIKLQTFFRVRLACGELRVLKLASEYVKEVLSILFIKGFSNTTATTSGRGEDLKTFVDLFVSHGGGTLLLPDDLVKGMEAFARSILPLNIVPDAANVDEVNRETEETEDPTYLKTPFWDLAFPTPTTESMSTLLCVLVRSHASAVYFSSTSEGGVEGEESSSGGESSSEESSGEEDLGLGKSMREANEDLLVKAGVTFLYYCLAGEERKTWNAGIGYNGDRIKGIIEESLDKGEDEEWQLDVSDADEGREEELDEGALDDMVKVEKSIAEEEMREYEEDLGVERRQKRLEKIRRDLKGMEFEILKSIPRAARRREREGRCPGLREMEPTV